MFRRFLDDVPTALLCAVIGVLCLIVYGPHLGNDFVSIDDGPLIYQNPVIQELTARSVGYTFKTYDPELYVPLTLISYQLEHAMFGLWPAGYHFTNLMLHIANALLVFAIITMLLRNRTLGCVVALLFAIHPIQTEAVLWAAARKDLLSSLFFLGSLCLYLRYRESEKPVTYWASVGVFLLSLLSKVSGLLLPFVLLGIDWVQGRKWTKRMFMEKIPYLILSIVFGIIAVGGKSQALGTFGLWERILLLGKSIVFFLRQLIVPLQFSVIYPQSTPVTFASPEFFAPFLIVAALGIVALLMLRWNRVAAFCLLFFLGMLAPSFSTFYKNGFLFFASDRYVYLASIGIFVLVALVLQWIARRGKALEITSTVVVTAAIFVLGMKTYAQGTTWKNSEALYTNVIAQYPESAMAHNNLADILRRQNRLSEAEAAIAEALRLDPQNLAAHVNAGLFREARGDIKGGIEYLRKAVAITDKKPQITIDDAGVYVTLAQMLERSGDRDSALAVYVQVTKKGPLIADAHHNLGLAYEQRNRTTEAIAAYDRALALNPNLLASHYHLAGLLASLGRLPEAMAHLEKIVAINPGYEKAGEHLQKMRAMVGK